MTSAYKYKIFLPLSNPDGGVIDRELFEQSKAELVDKFGGLTAYLRSPATGFWVGDKRKKEVKDQIIVYEVIAQKREKEFWKLLKPRLEHRFRQSEVMITVSEIDLV